MIAGTAQDIAGQMGEKREAEGSKWADAAFEELYLANYVRIVGVLCRLVGDRTRAEELANDVFWRLYRQRLLLDRDGNVAGWLYRAATNVGIDALRASVRRRQYEGAAARLKVEAGAGTSPLEEVLREEKRSRVRAVLARLKPVQAQLLILRAGGFSYKELAEALGVKGGSVGTMLARAEAEFHRSYIEAYGQGEEP